MMDTVSSVTSMKIVLMMDQTAVLIPMLLEIANVTLKTTSKCATLTEETAALRKELETASVILSTSIECVEMMKVTAPVNIT